MEAGAGQVPQLGGQFGRERFPSQQQAAQTAGHEWKKGKRQKKDPAALPNLSAPVRLAVEMAVNEENERYALEGELALLELEWKEAEEIAAIADKLLVPEDVERKLRELKGE